MVKTRKQQRESVWERRARTAEKDLERMTQERDALREQLKEAQESAQTYAHRFHQMKDKNVELDAEADRLKRTDTELREEVRRLRKEAADHPAVVEKLQAELKAERHRVAELRQKNDLQLAQVQALREQLKEAQDQLAVYQLTTTVEDAEEYLAQELKAEQEAHALTQAALGQLRARMKREAKTPQTAQQTAPQTAPQTCRCSEHEERLRALLERVVSLESRMDAVSEASRLRRIFEGGG